MHQAQNVKKCSHGKIAGQSYGKWSGLTLIRVAGTLLGLILVLDGIQEFALAEGTTAPFPAIRNLAYVLFGGLLLLPWRRLAKAACWRSLFTVFAASALAFAFVLVFEVLFETVASVEMGQKTALPAIEGVMAFIGLMQIPAVLFIRRPELLE